MCIAAGMHWGRCLTIIIHLSYQPIPGHPEQRALLILPRENALVSIPWTDIKRKGLRSFDGHVPSVLFHCIYKYIQRNFVVYNATVGLAQIMGQSLLSPKLFPPWNQCFHEMVDPLQNLTGNYLCRPWKLLTTLFCTAQVGWGGAFPQTVLVVVLN